MAPTGRASRRMAESTGVDEARTLHSALGLGTGEEIGDSERVRFVDADLVIVDEFSMVDMWLAQQFFKHIGQHTRVVLVGDPNQLPSVGAGNVFYELIHSERVPVTVLDWIFRQSKDGLIAYNAKFINEGSTKLYYGNDFVFVDSPTQIETARCIQEDLTMLRELNAGIDTLRAYQQYTKLNLRGRQELLQWQIKNHVHSVSTQWFAYMTARKFMRYMDSQLPNYMRLKRAFLYRSPMEEAISTYSDYLQMCQEQNYDMKSSQVLFPKHCNEAHDELNRYIKKCRDEQTKRAFREVYENLAEKANLTSKKLQIVCPRQTDDLIAEGQALHHCVGTYIERVAAKKCLIVFVRRVEEPKKPYVTVEVRNGKIEQIHGDHNSDPTEEVKKFVDLWSRKVLPMALQVA